MIERHKRWFCDGCTREWVHAHRWTPEQGCPACGATAIRQVEYEAVGGLDLPRGTDALPMGALEAPTPADESHVLAPPTVLVAGAQSRTPIAYDGGYL